MPSATAYHEAAHGIASEAHGIPVGYLSVNRIGRERGRTWSRERSEMAERVTTAPSSVHHIDLRDEADALAAIALAGPIAEHLVTRPDVPPSEMSKEHWLDAGGTGDCYMTRLLAERVGGTREDAWIDLQVYNAGHLVRQYWPAIEETARRLDEVRVLAGFYVRQALERQEVNA